MKMERKNAWKEYTEAENSELEKLNESYRKFLDAGKTERECVKQAVAMAEAAGYLDLKKVIEEGKQVKAGDKLYAVNMKKSLALFQIGKQPLEKGMAILGAHIDSPRLDIKQNPLYEDTELAYLDTHYYGGIKKYQWVTLPLAIHGVIAKKDGTIVDVCIGEDENDPVFCVTDLLIHLAGENMEKKANKVIEGEALDILVGSRPLKGAEKEAVSKQILSILKEKYDMEEEDFLSAELEVVPAGKSRESGLDASMIMAYGQDDRVCAYTSLVAMLEVENTEYTTCCLLVDKEEIGSVGATGGLGWANVDFYGMYTYLTCEQTDADFAGKLMKKFAFALDNMQEALDADAYGSTIKGAYPWGSNMTIANNGMLYLMMEQLGTKTVSYTHLTLPTT
mgnify:FL=1